MIDAKFGSTSSGQKRTRGGESEAGDHDSIEYVSVRPARAAKVGARQRVLESLRGDTRRRVRYPRDARDIDDDEERELRRLERLA